MVPTESMIGAATDPWNPLEISGHSRRPVSSRMRNCWRPFALIWPAHGLDNLFIARGQEAPDGDAEALVVGQGWQ